MSFYADLFPPLPPSPDLIGVASRVIWFEAAEDALCNVPRFVAYAMTYGTWREMLVMQRYLSEDDLRVAMVLAPAGIYDSRSWAYWHVRLGAFNVPPLPEKRLPEKVLPEERLPDRQLNPGSVLSVSHRSSETVKEKVS